MESKILILLLGEKMPNVGGNVVLSAFDKTRALEPHAVSPLSAGSQVGVIGPIGFQLVPEDKRVEG